MRLIACALLVLLAACGGGGDGSSEPDSAEAAIKRHFDQVDKGQWGPEWDSLRPAQQALIPRDHYIECNADDDPINVEEVKIIETYQEQYAVPGTKITTESTAITVEVTGSSGLLTDTFTDTFHEVNVDGIWRWSLASPEDYVGSKCPSF